MEESTGSLLDRESDFHDHVFAEGARARAAPFYTIVGPSKRLYTELALRDCEGLHVVEYGCGQGGLAFRLADRGARVVGIDVSKEAVRSASEKAEQTGRSSASFALMDAHALSFSDDSVDRVCGSGIIHHLDTDRAASEIARVLRPGGDAVFFEPLGHNPLIEWYRRRTPELRTPDEHPLLMHELDEIAGRFVGMDASFFHLTSLSAIPIRRTRAFDRVVSMLERLDQRLFSTLPWLSRFAWVVVIRLRA